MLISQPNVQKNDSAVMMLNRLSAMQHMDTPLKSPLLYGRRPSILSSKKIRVLTASKTGGGVTNDANYKSSSKEEPSISSKPRRSLAAAG